MSISGCAVLIPGGVSSSEPTTAVRPGSVALRPVHDDATRRSKANSRSAWPAATRLLPERWVEEMRMSLTTGPAFCDSPVWSSPATSEPSNIAAVPIIWDTVTTPVPPMPVIWTLRSVSVHGGGSAMPSGTAGNCDSAESVLCRHGRSGLVVILMKAGQSPLMHE